MRSLAIAVAGASCSGKTTLANRLADSLGATILRLDDYYRPLDHLTYEDRCEVNFDHPEAIDHFRLTVDVERLIAGERIEAPRYDFTRHTRFETPQTIESQDFVVVEGLFTLCYPELVKLCPIRIFVEASDETCLNRRIQRDVEERGRTPGEVISRFHGHVWPMYERHVLPTANTATLRVSGEGLVESAFQRLHQEVAKVRR